MHVPAPPPPRVRGRGDLLHRLCTQLRRVEVVVSMLAEGGAAHWKGGCHTHAFSHCYSCCCPALPLCAVLDQQHTTDQVGVYFTV